MSALKRLGNFDLRPTPEKKNCIKFQAERSLTWLLVVVQAELFCARIGKEPGERSSAAVLEQTQSENGLRHMFFTRFHITSWVKTLQRFFG